MKEKNAELDEEEWLEDFGTMLLNGELEEILERREPVDWQKTRQLVKTLLNLRHVSSRIIDHLESTDFDRQQFKDSFFYRYFKFLVKEKGAVRKENP